ncbi:MAG: aspartate kinase [Oscillospiraceae bacterium]|nr:aspartate kinase [Oscillospiraceae bacterium]
MNTKVVKFGGTSLADAQQFKKVADIIKSDPERRFVVPSAPGNRFPEDVKVTDMLYKVYEIASKNEDISEVFEQIKTRYNDIIRDLALDMSLDIEFAKIKNGIINKAGRDYTASRGEYLCGIIMSHYLGFPFIDAAEVIFFNNNGTFDAERTNAALRRKLEKYETAVIPGFYGIMPNGTIKTFPRDGTDITGAVVARAADAVLYENWKEVSGVLMADPRIIKNPKPIDIITYRELRELAYMGAKVMHEDSIFPVRVAKIPINIKNTNNPSDKGTFIVSHTDSLSENTITGIAGKKSFVVITLEKDMMNAEIGFVKRVLEVFEKYNINFEHLPTGIDTLSIIINEQDGETYKDVLFKELQANVNPDSIEYQKSLSLIAVVGRGMIRNKGTAAKIFKAIAEADVNIRMIDQGSSELNIIIGVNDSDFEKAMQAIYNAFA